MRRCLIHGSLPRELPRSKRSLDRANSTHHLSDLSRLLRMGQQSQASFLRSDNLTKFAVPSLVHMSNWYRPLWFIGFCRDGRPYSNRRPHKGACRHLQLPRLWNFLLVCPPIHSHCRQKECLAGLQNATLPSCSDTCRLSIQCGGRVNYFHSIS